MYNTGTVTTTANSTKVTGTNTKWKDNNSLVSAEQVILIQNGTTVYINSIASIQSDTELTLSFAAPAAVKNGSYRILTTMVNSISDAANKLVAMNNANAVFSEVLNRMFTETGIITVVLPDGTTLKTKTFAEMDKQLDGKLDKSGGSISGKGEVLVLRKTDSNSGIYLRFKDVNESDNMGYVGFGGKDKTMSMANQAAGSILMLTDNKDLTFNGVRVIRSGDFGLGGSSVNDGMSENDFTVAKKRQFGFFYHNSGSIGAPSQYGGGIFFGRDPQVSTKILHSPDWNTRLFLKSPTSNTVMSDWVEFYSTGNTTKDSNGNLKAASPVIKVFADHIENNDESEGVELEKLGTGRYKLKGTLGMHSDASWGGIHGGLVVPNGINNLPLVWADFNVLPDGDIVIETRYRKHALHQMLEAQRLMTYPEFLDENNEEREDYDYCDIPNGHWIDVRVNMPSNSIYNQKQAEAERLAKIEAERLAQEEAKRAAEEAERAEQEGQNEA
ncbi:hypothetical protein ABN306_10935 [Providencia huaxiensis]|uniref:phage tail fiber protein n=1 Tax=Providencia huaxiensis TaxID=2027290 RepID=UPI0032D9D82F